MRINGTICLIWELSSISKNSLQPILIINTVQGLDESSSFSKKGQPLPQGLASNKNSHILFYSLFLFHRHGKSRKATWWKDVILKMDLEGTGKEGRKKRGRKYFWGRHKKASLPSNLQKVFPVASWRSCEDVDVGLNPGKDLHQQSCLEGHWAIPGFHGDPHSMWA